MVQHVVSGTGKFGSETCLGDSHPDGVAHTLPKRSRCCLYARSMAKLWVTRSFAAPLSKALDVIEGEIVSGEM